MKRTQYNLDRSWFNYSSPKSLFFFNYKIGLKDLPKIYQYIYTNFQRHSLVEYFLYLWVVGLLCIAISIPFLALDDLVFFSSGSSSSPASSPRILLRNMSEKKLITLLRLKYTITHKKKLALIGWSIGGIINEIRDQIEWNKSKTTNGIWFIMPKNWETMTLFYKKKVLVIYRIDAIIKKYLISCSVI